MMLMLETIGKTRFLASPNMRLQPLQLMPHKMSTVYTSYATIRKNSSSNHQYISKDTTRDTVTKT
jgi:hypothetical protein